MSPDASAADVLNRMRQVATRPAARPARARKPAPADGTADAAALPSPVATAPEHPVPAPATHRTQAVRPIRYTLDLARDQHRFLKRFAFDAEVDASEVMRSLLSLLEHDHALTARVHDRLRH